MTVHRLRLSLNVVAAALGIAGAALLLAPPASGVAPEPLAFVPSGDRAMRPVDAKADSLTEEIVLANIFSPSRTAPLKRVMPPELAGDSANGMISDTTAVSGGDTPPGPATDGSVPSLYGTIVGPSGTQALLQLDAAAPSPRLYNVGDKAGGYRIIAIAPREVTLAGPRGRVVLRMKQQEERP
jgi:hypothetical protein